MGPESGTPACSLPHGPPLSAPWQFSCVATYTIVRTDFIFVVRLAPPSSRARLIFLSDILSFFGETCLKKDSVVSVKYNLNIVGRVPDNVNHI